MICALDKTITNSFKYCGVVLLLSFLHTSNTRAQDSSKTAPIKELETLELSDKKLSELQKEQAGYFTEISSKEIQNSAAQSTADVLQATGKVVVQKSQQGGGSPILRGFEANKVLIVVDGLRLNNLIFRGGHLQNIITIDPLTLESAEVMMGQGSTLFGSDALGGVIHLSTLRLPYPSTTPTHRAKFYSKYSSANRGLNFHVDYSHGDSNWSSVSSLSYSNYGDLRMGNYLGANPNSRSRDYYIKSEPKSGDLYLKNKNPLVQKYSGYEQIDLMHKHKFIHNPAAHSKLNLQYSRSSIIPRYDRLTNTNSDNDSLKYAEWYYGPQVRLMAAYEFQKFYTPKKRSWNTLVAFQNLQESRYTRKYLDSIRKANEENVYIYSVLSTVQQNLQNGFIKTGIDVNVGTVESSGYGLIVSGPQRDQTLAAQSRYPNGNNIQLNTALFGLRHWRLTPETYADVGMRLGYTSLRSSTQTSFGGLDLEDYLQQNPVYSIDLSLGKNYDSGLHLSANLGTGYRVPNLDDLAKIFDSSPGIVIVPNENLRAEETINLNINLAYKNKKINAQVSPFGSRMFEAIAVRPYKYDGQDSIVYQGQMSQVVANQNLDNAWIFGLNADFSYQMTQSLKLRTNFSYTYGQLYEGDSLSVPLDHIPPVTGIVAISYTRERWDAVLDCRYNGWKRLHTYSLSGEDNIYYAPRTPNGELQGMPAWYTINTKVSTQLGQNWILNAGIENILDLRYQVFASGIVAPGRNIFFSLLWDASY